MAETNEQENRNFQLILDESEYARYIEVLRKAKNHDPRLKNSAVNRILLGLAQPNKAVTRDDIKFFQGHSAQPGVMRKAGEESTTKNDSHRRRANGE
jgi:hypothetical protein